MHGGGLVYLRNLLESWSRMGVDREHRVSIFIRSESIPILADSLGERIEVHSVGGRFFARYDFDQYVRALVRVGIDGYLLKDSPQSEVVDALREIISGGVVLPPRIASKVMRSYTSSPSDSGVRQFWELTIREIEVLELLHEGLRNIEIGRRLAISPRTVESHVSSVISKLGAQSRSDAVRIAADRGLLT